MYTYIFKINNHWDRYLSRIRRMEFPIGYMDTPITPLSWWMVLSRWDPMFLLENTFDIQINWVSWTHVHIFVRNWWIYATIRCWNVPHAQAFQLIHIGCLKLIVFTNTNKYMGAMALITGLCPFVRHMYTVEWPIHCNTSHGMSFCMRWYIRALVLSKFQPKDL